MEIESVLNPLFIRGFLLLGFRRVPLWALAFEFAQERGERLAESFNGRLLLGVR
jgi:hypothetical protein